MNKLDPQRLINIYRAGVQHPEVSGMEHLQLLQIRSALAKQNTELTAPQQEQIEQADRVLLAHSDQFLHAIEEIANLASWRQQEEAPPTQWWWYLDVIAHLPMSTYASATKKPIVEALLA